MDLYIYTTVCGRPSPTPSSPLPLPHSHRPPTHATHTDPPPTPPPPRPVGGPTKTNRPSSPTKAEQQHDRHVSKSGVRGEAKKHGAGSKGTWGSVEDDIKEAIKEAKDE